MKDEIYMVVDYIGRLRIIDEIIYYEKLLTFTCLNEVGNLYIASCIDIDSEENETWHFLPISEHKLKRVLEGGITAYDAFVNSEMKLLWEVEFKAFDYYSGKSKIISPDSLSEEDLPDPDIVYDIHADNLFSIDKQQLNKRDIIATKENREILDISLEMDNTHIHEISATFLGNVLNQTQKIINLISYKNSDSHKVPSKIKEESTLIYTGEYAASFGFRLKSDKFTDLLGESALGESIDVLMDLMNSDVNLINFQKLFANLNPNVLNAYREYLVLLSKENASIITKSSSPNKNIKQSRLSNSDIKDKLDILKNSIEIQETTMTQNGCLVAADVTNNQFKFETIDSEIIKGKISNEINLNIFELPRDAQVSLIKRKEKDLILNKEKYEYILTDVEYFI